MAASQPMAASQVKAASQPVANQEAPWPAWPRATGIEPNPTFQIGGDLRLAFFAPADDIAGGEGAFSPCKRIYISRIAPTTLRRSIKVE